MKKTKAKNKRTWRAIKAAREAIENERLADQRRMEHKRGFDEGRIAERATREYEERRYAMAEKLIEQTAKIVDSLAHMMPYVGFGGNNHRP